MPSSLLTILLHFSALLGIFYHWSLFVSQNSLKSKGLTFSKSALILSVVNVKTLFYWFGVEVKRVYPRFDLECSWLPGVQRPADKKGTDNFNLIKQSSTQLLKYSTAGPHQ